jgi:hypothetical protein
MPDEILVSAVRDKGDLAGVYEVDGESGYFYLYEMKHKGKQHIVDSLHVFSGKSDLKESDVAVRWDHQGNRVGLFIRGVLWAVYNIGSKQKYGGNYKTQAEPQIPEGETFNSC